MSAPLEPQSPTQTIALVHKAYQSLIASAPNEENLGGRLFYTGELDLPNALLIRAANIAGAASLAASANAFNLRQAQREGVIDFLVNSLDEALRILKNEIRKRQPVAVAVSIASHTITREMLERGVQPDLLPTNLSATTDLAAFLALGAAQIPLASSAEELLIWPIPVAYTNRPAEFESILLAHLPPAAHAARRWLHLSPRYLDAPARRFRSIPLDPQSNSDTAEELTTRFGPPLRA